MAHHCTSNAKGVASLCAQRPSSLSPLRTIALYHFTLFRYLVARRFAPPWEKIWGIGNPRIYASLRSVGSRAYVLRFASDRVLVAHQLLVLGLRPTKRQRPQTRVSAVHKRAELCSASTGEGARRHTCVPSPSYVSIFRISGLRGICPVTFLESMRCGYHSWNQ